MTPAVILFAFCLGQTSSHNIPPNTQWPIGHNFDVFSPDMPPPGFSDTLLPQMPPPMWEHPKLFTGAQEQLLHPMFQQLPPLPPNVVPGPMFFGQPCIQGHGHMPPMWQPVPYDFKYWDKKPNIGRWEGTGPVGKNGQVNSWWNPIGVWGNKGQVIGADDWNFAKQWGNPGYVPNNNVVLKVSNGGGVPNPPKQPKVEVKTPVQPPVQIPVKTPVKPVVLPPVQPPVQPTQPPVNPVPEVKVEAVPLVPDVSQPRQFDIVNSRSN